MTKRDEIVDLYGRHVMGTYAPCELLVRGKGTRVWDGDGKVYLDFMTGISVLNVGHSHPRVVNAIQDQAATLMHCSNLYYNENQPRLAARLSALSMGGKCFFCNSGAEANEGLIKLSRLWGHNDSRYELICLTNSFHGRTLATAAATGQAKVQKGFTPLPVGFVYAEMNDLESVRALITEKTVGVLFEVVQGEGGVVLATADFVQGIRALCDEHNLLMLCDEVQCGMGRTGKWWAFQHYDVAPDAFSLAKGLGSGFPIGAVVASPKLSDVFTPGTHASTFGGNPLACAAALATLDVIEEEGLVQAAEQNGDLFLEGLADLVDRFEHVVEARGKGLMIGLQLDTAPRPLVDRLRDMGLLCIATGENVVRFLPPLNVKENDLEEALEMIEDALTQWQEEEAAVPGAGADEATDEAGVATAEEPDNSGATE